MKKLLYIIGFLICFVMGAKAQFPITQNLGSPSTQVLGRGGIAVDSGFTYRTSFADTTAANIGWLKNIPGITIRTVNTLWIRSNDALRWIEFGAGSLNVDTTESILLRGDGSTASPLTASLQVSSQSGNGLQIFPDGAYVPVQVQNGRISGGEVIWQTGLTYIVTPAVYAIGGIVYNSPQTTITLDNADPSNGRIDGFVVTTSGTAIDLTGTPSTDPQNPSFDPTTQLPLTFVLVGAGATEPTYCRDSIYYVSNGQTWTGVVSNTGRINTTSTNNPYSVPQDVEFTLAQNNDQYRVTKSTTVTFSTYSVLAFQIRSKGTWPANSRVIMRWYNGLTPLGIDVVLGDGIFGFNSSNTADYQLIAIPRQNFGSVVSPDNILFTISTTGANTIGFYLDDIQLLGCNGTPPSVSGSFWQVGGNTQGTTLVGGTLDNYPVQLKTNNTNALQISASGQITTLQGTNPILSMFLGTGANSDYFWQRTGTTMLTNTAGDYINRFQGNTVYSFIAASGHIWNSSAAAFNMQLNASGNLLLGTNSNNANTIFNISSTTKGSHPAPSMTAVQMNAISTPLTGDLVFNTTAGVHYYYNGAAWVSLSQVLTASEGLEIASNVVKIGGNPFTENRSIPTSAFSLTIASSNATNSLAVTNSSTGAAIFGSSTSGNGVVGYSNAVAGYGVQGVSFNNGYGVYGSAIGGGAGVLAEGDGTAYAAQAQQVASSTNTTLGVITVNRLTTGTAAAGIGGSIDFRLETTNGISNAAGSIKINLSDAVQATRAANFVLALNTGSSQNDRFTLANTGALRLHAYGSGTFTGTPTFALSVDASGNIIETTAGSGMTNPMTTTGDIIYSSDNSGTPARRGVGSNGDVLTLVAGVPQWVTPGVGGTVTTVGWTGGVVSIANPTTTPAFTIAGTSGGIPYFSSSSTWATSAALAANAIVIGGGAGVAPSTTTTASGILTFIATPSSANLAAAVTDETGSGALVFATSPTFVTPNLGTPNSGTITTGVTIGDVTMNVTGTDATGDIYYRSAGGVLTRLGIGSTGQVLIVAAGLPSWGSASASGTVTITQPSAGITFTNSGVAQTLPATFTVALANDLLAVENLATTGIVRRTGTSTWSAGTAVNLGTEVSSFLQAANGGTGFAGGYTAGQIIWASGTNSFARGNLNGTSNQINVASSAGGVTISHAFNPTVQTLTSGATITWNITNGANSALTLNNTGATLNITNPIAGYTYTIVITQGSGGSRTITTWPSGTIWPNATPITLSTTAGQRDIISFYYNGTNYFPTYGNNYN